MIESRVERQDPPLIAIPNEHKPVIAKLAHERCADFCVLGVCVPWHGTEVLSISDKSITVLAKHIQHELLPTQDVDENTGISAASLSALPLQVVEAAIKSIMNRNNYGLDVIPGGGKVPTAMCIWRWEVKDQHIDWLPKNSREKAEVRVAERIQVGFLCPTQTAQV